VKKEHVVARTNDVPEGTHVVVSVGRREFGIFNVRGEYHALANACFHQNGPLCLGATSGTMESGPETGFQPRWTKDGEIVVCPWHALEFDIKTGHCLAFPARRVPTYEVRVRDGEIRLML